MLGFLGREIGGKGKMGKTSKTLIKTLMPNRELHSNVIMDSTISTAIVSVSGLLGRGKKTFKTTETKSCCIIDAQNEKGKDFWLNKGMKQEKRSTHIYRLLKNNQHIYKTKFSKLLLAQWLVLLRLFMP